MIIAGVLLLVSLIRWFEQVTEAVDLGWWSKVTLLLLMPPAVWFFPSRVSAGRPSMVPRHEPAMGFGLSAKPQAADASAPAPRKMKRSSIDPAQMEKLRQKMREQGMLPPEE
ncbi:MAG TPA: hypothetical protein VL282_04770 [Tepidisphaeraceae bacterium]|jgi:hypothetical protein|nr:hypothetical protein [Tepidisphaeraceae bacterium]